MALSMAFLMIMTTVMSLTPTALFATDIIASGGSLESSSTPSAPAQDPAPIAPALAEITPTSASTLEVGKTYLVDIASRDINDLSSPSPTASFNYLQAVVEVKGSGATVSFFQTSFASDITDYLYDAAQSDATNSSSEGGLVPAIEALNGDSSVKRITVEWPNLEKSLYIKMTVPKGTPESGITGPSRARLVLDISTAAIMTAAPFTGFGATSPEPEPEPDPGPAPGIYLVPFTLTNATGGSSSQASNFDNKAVVKVTATGNTVSVFQTGGIIEPPPVDRVSTGLIYYKYDAGQHATFSTGAAAATFVAALREELNAAKNAQIISVDWPNLDAELLASAMNYRGAAMAAAPVYFGLKLDMASATPLSPATYKGFDFSDPAPVADKTALQAKVDEAAALPATSYTATSYTHLLMVLASAQTVLDDPTATQTEVDDATGALAAAIAALVPVPTVDKTALQNKVNEALALNPAAYTATSFSAVTSALSSAQTVLANVAATQSDVDSALSALASAIAALVDAPTPTLQVGKTYLVDIKAKNASNVNELSSASDYYHGKAVVVVRADGYTVNFFQIYGIDSSVKPYAYGYKYDQLQSDSNASVSLVNAFEETNSTMTAMRIEVQWPDITRRLLVSMSIDTGVYPMPGIMNQPMRMELVPATAVELTATTYQGFNFAPVVVDKSGLQTLVDQVKGKISQESTFTPNSFKAFKDAYNKALEVLANTAATEAEISAAYTALNNAHKMLAPKADKTALSAQLTRASKIVRTDYTETGLSMLDAARKAAQSVFDDPNASQADVDAARTKLESVLNDLVNYKRPTGGSVVTKDNMTTGRYTVQVDFWHQDKTGPSNANPSLNHTAIIDVASNGAMTMSISTKPIKVGSIVAVLRALDINGSPTSVIARNITLDGQSYASAFSFPLPNKEMYHPAVFHLTANPGPSDPPGWLRIGWDTLQAAPGAGLSTDTTVANATRSQAGLDNVERTNQKTDKEAAKPKMSVAGAATTDDTGATAEATGLGGVLDNIAQSAANASWLTWALAALGTLGVFGLGWVMGNRRAVPKAVGQEHVASVMDEPEAEPVIENEEDRRVYDSTEYKNR